MSITPHKKPLRSCISCRQTCEKRELVRFVRVPDGTVELDVKGNAKGRGAYICADKDCFDDVRRRRKLNAALKVTLLDDDYDRLQRDFEACITGADAQ